MPSRDYLPSPDEFLDLCRAHALALSLLTDEGWELFNACRASDKECAQWLCAAPRPRQPRSDRPDSGRRA